MLLSFPSLQTFVLDDKLNQEMFAFLIKETFTYTISRSCTKRDVCIGRSVDRSSETFRVELFRILVDVWIVMNAIGENADFSVFWYLFSLCNKVVCAS